MRPTPIGIVQYWGGCPQMPNSKWRRFLRLMQACRERQWQTTIVWSQMPSDPGLWRPFQEAGARIVIQPRARGNFDPLCIVRTYKLLRSERCSIFHCHNVHTSPLAAAAWAKIPVRVWSKLSMSADYEQGTRPSGLHQLQLSTRLSAFLAHRVLCISEAVRDELLQQGIASEKLIVSLPPIELSCFAKVSSTGLRSHIGLDDGSFVITTVGHAVPVKAWDVLVNSFALVAAAHPEARLLLVGSMDAPHEAETSAVLRNLVERLGIRERVLFLGRRADVAAILAATDVFVLPSRSEGLSSALLEAMAAGLPCIGSRTGGTPSVIANGKNGLLVDREDAKGLADAIIGLARNPVWRRALGIAARSSVQRFELGQVVSETLSLYESLLSKRDGASSDGLDSRHSAESCRDFGLAGRGEGGRC